VSCLSGSSTGLTVGFALGLRYNFILVVGKKEQESQTVNVRTRDNVVHGQRSIADLLDDWAQLVSRRG
jgi:threonyl-tRNA synthetase